jgi:hypothetical protein
MNAEGVADGAGAYPYGLPDSLKLILESDIEMSRLDIAAEIVKSFVFEVFFRHWVPLML